MFTSKTCGGKAFAAEQKITEFKTLLFKSKRLHKATKKTRLDSKKLINNAVETWTKQILKNRVIHLKQLKKNPFWIFFEKFMIFIE